MEEQINVPPQMKYGVHGNLRSYEVDGKEGLYACTTISYVNGDAELYLRYPITGEGFWYNTKTKQTIQR